MITKPKNANAPQKQGISIKQNQHKPTQYVPNRELKTLSGWHLYEYLKRSYIDSNPSCTNSEFEQAMARFASLAGV